jgi:glc operon protein GlcG
MNLDQANEIVARARKAAEEMGVGMSIAVVDASGHLVAFGRMEGTAFMTPEIAIGKAWTAAGAGVPTAVLAPMLAAEPAFLAGAAVATHGRFLAGAGGVPIVVDGEVVGGVGASGGTGEQDAAAAEAGAGATT